MIRSFLASRKTQGPLHVTFAAWRHGGVKSRSYGGKTSVFCPSLVANCEHKRILPKANTQCLSFNFEIELRTRLTVQNWDIDTCELGPSHVLNAVHNDNCSPRLGSSSFVPTTFLRQKFYVTNERDGASMVFRRYIRHVCVPTII